MHPHRTLSRLPARRAHPWLALPAALIPLAAASGMGASVPALFGFTAHEAPVEQSLEQRFDAALNPAELREWMKNLSSAPNHVGSPHDKANAEFVRDRFREWGWQAQIEEFEVLYPTLKQHTLELVAPTHFTASLTEPPVAGDATSGVAGHHAALQRLWCRWRCDRRARLRQLRHAEGLRGARASRHRRHGAGSSSRATAMAGGDSSRSSRRSTAPSAASSIPTRAMTATRRATSTRRAAGARPRACSAARCLT